MVDGTLSAAASQSRANGAHGANAFRPVEWWVDHFRRWFESPFDCAVTVNPLEILSSGQLTGEIVDILVESGVNPDAIHLAGQPHLLIDAGGIYDTLTMVFMHGGHHGRAHWAYFANSLRYWSATGGVVLGRVVDHGIRD